MNRKCLTFAFIFTLLGYGAPAPAVPTLGNLDTAGGDIHGLFSGTGYGVGFHVSANYLLNSVTIEEYGYPGPPPWFHVQIFSLGPIGGVASPGWPWMSYADLNDAGVDGRPWSSSTTLVDYSPGSPLMLTPDQPYMIGLTAGPGSPGEPALLFASSEGYSLSPDWQTYASENQWRFDPNYNQWLSGGPVGAPGIEGLKLEINATPVPEPGLICLVLLVVAPVLSRRRRGCRRASSA